MNLKSSSCLVISYFLTTWNVRSDEWGTALFLSFLHPNTLLPVSVYSLASSLASIVTSPAIGYAIDKTPRLSFLVSCLLLLKLCIASISLLLLYQTGIEITPSVPDQDRSLGLNFWFIVAFGVVLRSANVATTIAVERNWAHKIAKDSTELAGLNSRLRSVDLIGKLVAPLVVSAIAAYSVSIAIISIASFSTLSLGLELYLIILVFRQNPGLSEISTGEEPIQIEDSAGAIQVPQEPIWKAKVFPTCVSISLLYLNVLSFGPVMIAFLTAQAVSAPVIAALRAISVLFGLLATLTFSKLINKIGLIRSGLWGIWLEMIMLTIAVSSFYFPTNLTSLIILLTGVSISRWGLWTFDLTQGQLVQEIEFERIGTVSGVQMMMQNVFELTSYAVTIIWYDPSQFWIPCWISLGCGVLAASIYTRYAVVERGHIFHIFDR